MDQIGNIAPVAVALLVGAIAWVPVRRAYRKAPVAASTPQAERPSAAE